MSIIPIETRRLYSEQGIDLQSFAARLDLTRGTYSTYDRIREAQERLYREYLGTDQVIWCGREVPETVPLETARYVHTIQADKRDVVAVLDGFLWEHIIGNDRCIPPEIREYMRFSCSSVTGDKHAALMQLEDEYLINNLPNDPWDSVLVADLDCRMSQVLLAWPFKYSRIVNVK